MPRPPRCRFIDGYPEYWRFTPLRADRVEVLVMTPDEYEIIRLIDKCGLTQELCASCMYNSNTARAVALLLGCVPTASILAGCSSGDTKPGEDGGYTAYGMAECTVEDAGITYPVYLVVKTDENGVIL